MTRKIIVPELGWAYMFEYLVLSMDAKARAAHLRLQAKLGQITLKQARAEWNKKIEKMHQIFAENGCAERNTPKWIRAERKRLLQAAKDREAYYTNRRSSSSSHSEYDEPYYRDTTYTSVDGKTITIREPRYGLV